MASFIGSPSPFTSTNPEPSSSSQPQQSQTSTGSTTITSQSQSSQPVLRLRGVRSPQRSIRWAEDVVDNEGLGRKSSKGTGNQFYFCLDLVYVYYMISYHAHQTTKALHKEPESTRLTYTVCCIFHPARSAGESSDESSSSSSSSSSDENSSEEGNARSRRLGAGRNRRVPRRNSRQDDCDHHLHHETGTDYEHAHVHAAGNEVDGNSQQTRRRHSPNAYERMPKTSKARKGGGGTMTEVVRQ